MLHTLFRSLLIYLCGPLAFIASVGLAGILNRSLLLVPALALTATATSVLLRSLIPSLRSGLQMILRRQEPVAKVAILSGAIRGFVLRWLGYGAVFFSAAMLAALFQATDFAPRIERSDLWFLCLPVAIAIPSRWLSHQLGVGRAVKMRPPMRSVFERAQTGSHPHTDSTQAPFTIEAEIIRDDAKTRQTD